MLSTFSNQRGYDFEEIIYSLLNMLASSHQTLVKILRHHRIKLLNETEVIPDFELIYELPHQKDHRLIECQDRAKSSQEIVRKIRDIKSLSSKNRFVFVYKDEGYLTDEVKKALDSDGIVHYSFLEFCAFLRKLNETLSAVSNTEKTVDFEKITYEQVNQSVFLQRLNKYSTLSSLLTEPSLQCIKEPSEFSKNSFKFLTEQFGKPFVNQINNSLKNYESKKDEEMLSSPPKKFR